MTDEAHAPPAAVTPEVFKSWRSPRRGATNPERMDNPLWEWLIECRLNAYSANKMLNGPSPFSAGPMWCFDRFGQSTTPLSDGRTLLIAGEHEDYYDPDFYIYNDLVVVPEAGKPEIYGYPVAAFPPTDFHSASVVDDRIVLVGNLGYPADRRVGRTQVLVVQRDTWSVSRVDTVGPAPGWIHSHNAELRSDGASLLLTGGKLYLGEDASLVENIDDWALHLDGWRWERLTERRWTRFEVQRSDRKRNHVFEMRQVLWSRQMRWDGLESQESRLRDELGALPDLELIPSLYRPPVAHEVLPQKEDEYSVHRIRVEGTVVRYVEEGYTVQATVEGKLEPEIVEQLRRDLTRKLETLEQTTMACRDIPS